MEPGSAMRQWWVEGMRHPFPSDSHVHPVYAPWYVAALAHLTKCCFNLRSTVVRLEGSQKNRASSWSLSRLYVEVKLGEDTRKTRAVKKNKDISWEEHLILYVH